MTRGKTRNDVKTTSDKTLKDHSERVSALIKQLDERLTKVKDGYTPIKGIDYNDGQNPDPEDIAKIVLGAHHT